MSRQLTNKGSRQPIDLADPGQQITLLHDQWVGFKEETLPLALNEAQIEVLHQAFYAGAKGVLNVLDDAILDDLPNEEIGKVLPAIKVEIQRYIDSKASRHN